jgi:hypothetical protein
MVVEHPAYDCEAMDESGHGCSTFREAPSDHRLLGIGMSPDKHIYCTDVICICGKSAVHAAKMLTHPTFLRHRFAEWACSGGISGIDGNKTNTVLLRQHLDPCNNLPIRPRGDSFAKTLSSAGSLAQLQIIQIFYTEASKGGPRKPFHLPVDIIFARPRGAETTLTFGLASTNPGTDSLDFSAILLAGRIDEQLVDPNIDTKLAT